MSGDVQPRKRKDKKRKKDELGIEEPRGTAAVFGEGDVFMHSQHEHGTGGHWCAKIIFFSLLAILVTLIGLIILENRGLSELEANSVETRYSGVLDGWLEDAPDDDHHDEHTLELNHHDDDDDGHDEHAGDDDAHEDDDDEHDIHDEDENEDDDHDNEDDEQLEQDDEDEDSAQINEDDEDADNDADDQLDDDEQEQDLENDEEDEEHEEEDEHDAELEVEKLEKEASEEDLEPVSTELPALPEEEDDDDDKDEEGQSDEKEPEDEEDSGIEEEGEEFLDADDDDEPPVEKINVPAGKPFVEVEEEVSSEQPPDTLEEEEEYEKRQEELRREEAQASHMWLKLGVGGALLVATHAVMRRATHSRDTSERDDHGSREETPIVDRRLTLIPEEPPAPARKVEQVSRPVIEKQVLEKVVPVVKSVPIQKQESEEEEEEKEISEDEEEIVIEKPTDDKELYSEEEADEEVEEEEEEEIIPIKKEVPKLAPVVVKKPEPEPEPEPEEVEDDEDPEDVEIIGDEQLEEDLEEEADEEEISDVDDAELLSRLEAKYGKLPEPERPGQKHKDGGNSIEDVWPGEPSDAYWRQQLDSAEQELRQDWLD